MSCENPPGSAEATMPRRRKFDKTGICIKCKTNSGKMVIRHAVYCKACFLALITSKFRQVLDPTINLPAQKPLLRGSLRAPGNLMIGYSGGLGSTVLLDLVKSCYFSSTDIASTRGGKKHPRKSGRAWDRVVVCYIECCEGYAGALDRTHDVDRALEKYLDVFEFLLIRLEDAFRPSNRIRVDLTRQDLPVSTVDESDASSTMLLKAYLTSLPTTTSQQNSISSLIRLLLQHTARAHGCSHLLLGTSLTSLSVNLIDAVASGAGFTVGLEKAEDWRDSDSGLVQVVRPLREVSMKECAAYMRWRDLEVFGNQRILSAQTNNKKTIVGLTKDFIFGLERDYPSTVSAIVRTCDKLVSNTIGEKCILCERPAQPGIQEWKESISIRSLNQVETETSKPATEETNNVEHPPGDTLTSGLCYACHTTLTSQGSRGTRRTVDIGDGILCVPLPTWVEQNFQARLQARADMQAQIEEFLINSEEEGT
ncbi:hypothetical protein K439DRAFT_1650935 [Ramaria rubella]|nr:hypothetical protein K439DRAFT_1650935 [Ramaria rubella]